MKVFEQLIKGHQRSQQLISSPLQGVNGIIHVNKLNTHGQCFTTEVNKSESSWREKESDERG